MQAIADVGGELVLACDTHDAVGVLDRFAPDCRFTCNPTRFFDDLDDVDIVTVCTPNYLHVTHALMALNAGCDVVLEKPLSTCGTGMQSAETLVRGAKGLPHRIFPVVQLRYHDEIEALRQQLQGTRDLQHCEIDYSTYRGPWYDRSWKGNPDLSGGLVMNLGVHLFDLCLHLFGPFIRVVRAEIGEREASGVLRCEKALIRWRLSSKDREPKREFRIAGQQIDLTNQFHVLHRRIYEEVLAGRGQPLESVAEAIHVIDQVRGQRHADIELHKRVVREKS
jgi:UDP-N-acetyl-2-amino-2-deoxyglucuronate dehydrogenase